MIDALVAKTNLPRVLNSTDININPNDPQPLFTPAGDFNKDGIPDMAISGIYGLPSKNQYFLLVGTQFQNPVRSEALFFREYSQPVFLHKPGTTGDKDPGDQAFAITACSNCSDGFDFFWDPKQKTFNQVPWVKRVRHYQEIKPASPSDAVPPEVVDQALQIVGELPDIRIFVAGLQKTGKQLGTRVKQAKLPEAEATVVVVEVFEKKKKGENLYDALTVDVKEKKVVKRGKSK